MGISIWQLLIILAIVLVLFGAKRLRSVGSDLGAAIKGFKQSIKEEETKPEAVEQKQPDGQVFEAKAEEKKSDDTAPKA
ncbi:Sec-independent protein translocase subunit TatA [Sulfurivirga sp.]|uniref:Sec-independent protein translocase subunit TatA n=1 Tax=Sulfurivirga sp. TaxID=2614236 RepID=UPI00345BC4FF